MRVFILLLLTALFTSNCLAENAYLVGDLGIVKPDLRGILIADAKPMAQPLFYHEAEPVYDRSQTDGEVVVSSCVDMNDDGNCFPAEEGGFFSIVTVTDKD